MANAEDATIIVRIQTLATGKVEVSKKLSEVPKAKGGLGKTLKSLFVN